MSKKFRLVICFNYLLQSKMAKKVMGHRTLLGARGGSKSTNFQTINYIPAQTEIPHIDSIGFSE